MSLNNGKQIIDNWKANHKHIADLFHARKYQDAKEPVVYYTNELINALAVLNNQEPPEDQHVSKMLLSLKYAPFNSQERIPFILQQPEQYYSYIQLNELYKETEKLYAKVEILQKKTRNQ
ncbi:hypothetical protein BN1058_00932 [Paraliobacillus sp. PM-2]|uniref:YpoC family protein n=1 Tax=Paraliobacillus sp. PM-2 TaxID=1462524 RepID=UPI00061C852A|nr:hypothetical protein [Paraliobacillus sp. PM-2]CQR46660.1 hypothetical protein BN1058_00932 [Paraliobacillus sp. PM-2]